MGVESLDHLLHVVGASVHELVSEESFTLLLDALVHLGGLFHVLQVVLGLLVPLLHIVHLLLPEDELLVNVSLEGIVRTDKFLALLLRRMVMPFFLLPEHLALLAIDLCELRPEVVNLELKLLELVLESVSEHARFLTGLPCALNQHVDVLHHVVLLGVSRVD